MSNDVEPEVIGGGLSDPEQEEAAEEEGTETWIWMLGALLLGLSGSALLAIGGIFVLPEVIAGLGESHLVAARTLPAGSIINESDVKQVPGPALGGAPTLSSDVVGRLAEHVIYSGDPVHSPRLGSPVMTGAKTPADRSSGRSAWLKSDASIAGLMAGPGQVVSIWTLPSLGESKLVAENAIVLSQDDASLGGPTSDKLKVWLTGPDAEALTQARSMGLLLGVTLSSARDAFQGEEIPAIAPDAAQGSGPFRAARTLTAGEPIQADDLVQLGGEEPLVEEASSLVGQLPNRTILPGEQVSRWLLVSSPSELNYASRMAAGEHAVSLAIDDSPVELFKVGSQVDLLEVAEPPVEVALGVEIIGLTERGEGCPCTVVKIDEELAPKVLLLKSRGHLGMRFNEE